MGGRHHLDPWPRGAALEVQRGRLAIAFARIECHFFANHGFFPEEGWILKNTAALKTIPGWIVQGRFDVVTPIEAAWKLKTAWPQARWWSGTLTTPRPWPGIVDALVRATDQALSVLKLTRCD